MRPKETIGLGNFKKTLITDIKLTSFYKILALHNDVLFNSNEVEQIKDFLLNSNMILGDIQMPKEIKKHNNFYYAENPNKGTSKTSVSKKLLTHADPKLVMEYGFAKNLSIRSYNLFERYVLENVLSELIESANWYRVEQIINTAVLLGCNYSYIYERIDKI